MKILMRVTNITILIFLGLSVTGSFFTDSKSSYYSSQLFVIIWIILLTTLFICLGFSFIKKSGNGGYYIIHLSLLIFSVGLFSHGRAPVSGELLLAPDVPVTFNSSLITLQESIVPENPDGSPAQYITRFHICSTDKTKKCVDARLSVNHPFFIENQMLYQKSLHETLAGFTVKVAGIHGGSEIISNLPLNGTAKLSDGTFLNADAFYPDFYLDEQMTPHTRSEEMNNPMLHFSLRNNNRKILKEGYAFPEELSSMHAAKDGFSIVMLDAIMGKSVILGYASTKGVWYLLSGMILFLLGSILPFRRNHG